MKRKEKKRRKTPVLIILFLIVVVAAAGLAGEWITRRIPTDRKADLDAIYGSEEGTAAIIANHTVSENRALWTLGHAYLPYDVIRKELNAGFYWDPEEELLLYTLPEEVVSADTETAFDGAPVFLIEDGEVYISLTYVQQYSNISAENFDSPARIVLRTVWGSELVGTLGAEEALRVRGGVRSPVMENLVPGDQVVILEELENWDRVQSADGLIGYIRKSALSGTEEVTEDGPYTEPEYTHTDFPGDICMIWHQVFRSTGNKELAAFAAKKTPVNVICPTWLSMTETPGEIETRGDAAYVSAAHEAGMQVWVMLDNVNHEVDLNASLVPTSVRNTLTEKVFAELEAVGADGLNVDIERLQEETGDAYIQFIRELSVECRKRGLILSVDSGMPSGGGIARYHLDEQAKIIDYIVLMAYDEHYPGSDPGSTSSLEFVAQGIRDLLAKTEADRLICGAPFYTRVWIDSPDGLTSEALGMDGAAQYVKNYNMEVSWQEELGQNVASAKDGETVYQIWLEDNESQDARIRLIRANELKGIAFWKLGMDGSSVWDVIGKYYAAPDAEPVTAGAAEED
ncbi:MAG: glycosyl hydrolase family 18 [Lachnospiraceae bacterium]|nr:glycosyl hydrolase family 18 [Lachnospiraceae bacterium]